MDLGLYLEQLEKLVNIDSGSKNVSGINQVSDCLEEWYKQLGWQIKAHDLGCQTGRLLEISNRPCEYYDVMFVGHMDTVFLDGTAKERPFRIEGENYYGPGVGDMKNGDVAMYHVAANLSEEILNKLNIVMVYNPDEEIGSIYSQKVMDEIGKKTRFIFVMESAGNKGIRHCFARKGSMRYDIEFHGQAAHAGFMFEVENASAILEMGYYITKLMGLASREKDTTVNIGIAQGGTNVNVVADYAKICLEMRFKNDTECIRLKEELQKLIEGEAFVPGVKAEITYYRKSAPFVKTEAAKKYIDRLKTLAEELQIPFEEKDRGGLSDANHLSKCKDAIVLDGMGPHGALDHSEKEYGYIGSVEPCIKFLCRVLEDLAEKK
ncbi:MAG: M20 family metallopeptidase [Herbinix sp.]|nr:M20 family metallopeptidase [Herbinix sp.]